MYCNQMLPEENIEETPATIILNFNFSNIDNSHNVNNARINTHQNLQPATSDFYDNSWTMQDIKSFVIDYKWRISGAIVLSSYGLLSYLAIKGNYYLKRKDLWSSWRKDLNIDDMLSISQQKFAQELLQEINHRYDSDFTTSLMLFIKSIEQEEKDLEWYQSFNAWINYLHIQRLLFIDKSLYGQIAQRLQKLAYYRGCLESLKNNDEN